MGISIIMNRYIDGWLCEEAVCFVVGNYKSIAHIESIIENTPVKVAFDGDSFPDWTKEEESELSRAEIALPLARELLEALYHSVEIAIEHFIYSEKCEHANHGHILPEDLIFEQPTEFTEIELYRYIPDTPLKEVKIKKRSFAIWLYKLGERSMSEKACPEIEVRQLLEERELNKTSSSDIVRAFSSDFEGTLLGLDEEQIPDNLYWALSLYKQAWHDLPSDMCKPLKSDLEKLLRQSFGLSNSTLINSIIKVSTPKGVTLGGKQNPLLKPWQPKEKR